VEQRASRALSFSIRPRRFPPGSRTSPFLSTRVCKSLQRRCVRTVYMRRRMYLHDNIIPFLAYVDWLFFFVIDLPYRMFHKSLAQGRVLPRPLRSSALLYHDYHDRHYIKAYLESRRLANTEHRDLSRTHVSCLTMANDRDEG